MSTFDDALRAMQDQCWADLRCISEDDNRYCNPPRTRDLTQLEAETMLRDMLCAALPVVAAAMRTEAGGRSTWLDAADFVERGAFALQQRKP